MFWDSRTDHGSKLNSFGSQVGRRPFVLGTGVALSAYVTSLYSVRGAFADELTKTPPQTEGPYYPDKLPLDTDNDLIVINDDVTPAVGEITHLTGRVLDANGHPIRNAVVEIWQTDSQGVYIHTDDSSRKKRDGHFQGFGRFLTGSKGEYYFRTIKPTQYPGRTPHIHVKVKKGAEELLTTQFYIKGEAEKNAKDMIYNGIRDQKAKDSVTIDFTPIADSKIGELQASCDIVIGATPDEGRGGPPDRRRRGRRPEKKARP
jgi:protocatechuate 3,4-dioxygenase beta subunit